MSARRSSQVDLAKLFTSVTRALQENQQSLNEADDYNHNHGDNMVDNFQVITRAVRVKKGSPPSEQLAYASEILSQRSQSGSAQLYSRGLAQAADRFEGHSSVSMEDAMVLVRTLMGGQAQASAPQSMGGGMDLLGSLLGGQAAGQQSQVAGADMIGGLLGSILGGAPAAQVTQAPVEQAGGGIDLNDLLTAGMAFYQARQEGAEPVQALVQAVMAGSQMQNSTHHSQSGQLVAGTLINTLGSMLAGKKSAESKNTALGKTTTARKKTARSR